MIKYQPVCILEGIREIVWLHWSLIHSEINRTISLPVKGNGKFAKKLIWRFHLRLWFTYWEEILTHFTLDDIFNNMIFMNRRRWILTHNYIEQCAQPIKIPLFPWISSNGHSLNTDSRRYILQNYQFFFFPSTLISFLQPSLLRDIFFAMFSEEAINDIYFFLNETLYSVNNTLFECK